MSRSTDPRQIHPEWHVARVLIFPRQEHRGLRLTLSLIRDGATGPNALRSDVVELDRGDPLQDADDVYAHLLAAL
ncbi:MAG TPA: hypothetical protein VJQ57_15870, partial [Acidimicrobiia bacterium]|nr:hypothetical protein [Acidimicrobiia bacterium]